MLTLGIIIVTINVMGLFFTMFVNDETSVIRGLRATIVFKAVMIFGTWPFITCSDSPAGGGAYAGLRNRFAAFGLLVASSGRRVDNMRMQKNTIR